MAYQGFGSDLDQDAFAVRALTDAGVTCLVANSFSKNFRALWCPGFVCRSIEEAAGVLAKLLAPCAPTLARLPLRSR